jgi:hypothetical protein
MNGVTAVTRGAVSGKNLLAVRELKSLKELSEEIGVPENDLRRIVIYAGLKCRAGLYVEREFLRVYIRYLHEKLFGCAATYGIPKHGNARVRPGARLPLPR